MNPREAFLQDVIEHPDDDTPRRVYADWLEERGGPEDLARAEFIRVQFLLRDLSADDPRRLLLEGRQRGLLAAHGENWAAPLRGVAGVSGWEFRRGFVDKVTLSIEDFHSSADALFRSTPVQEVRLVCGQPKDEEVAGRRAMQRLADSPHLERVTALDLEDDSLWNVSLSPLASSPRLVRLTTLRLSVHVQSGSAAGGWAEAPFLPRLTSLRLRLLGNHYSTRFPQGGALLLTTPLNRLETLELSQGGVTEAELQAVTTSSHLGRLTTLRLGGNLLGTGDVRRLISCPGLPSMRTLDLSLCGLHTLAAHTLADAPLLGRLETLELSRNRLGDHGAQGLAASPHLARLQRLNLNANHIGPEGARALARADPSANSPPCTYGSTIWATKDWQRWPARRD